MLVSTVRKAKAYFCRVVGVELHRRNHLKQQQKKTRSIVAYIVHNWLYYRCLQLL